MQIDSFDPIMSYQDFALTENRFAILEKANKENKNQLLAQSEHDAKQRNTTYKKQKAET